MSEERGTGKSSKRLRVSGVRYPSPVGKEIRLADDGETLIKRQSLGPRGGAGEAINLCFATVGDFFEYRRQADAHTMLLSGTFPDGWEDKTVVPEAALNSRVISDDRDSYIAATGDNLEHRAHPSVVMIDIDRKGVGSVEKIWPPDPFAFDTPDEVRDAVHEILPEARGCPLIVLPSSSSMIAKSSDGQLLAGPGGWRAYLPIMDARDTPGILQIIHHRCWARERFNFAFVSKAGVLQFRSLADQALARPTQPDYPCAALGEGLERVSGLDRCYDPGGPWLDGKLVKITDADRALAGDAMRRVAAELKPDAEKVKLRRMEQDVRKSVVRGVGVSEAREAARRKYEDEILLGPEFIKFENGDEATVEGLLSSAGSQYDGAVCFDPVEPEYDGGRPVAKFFWNEGRAPVIHSFAHGDTNFYLRYDETSAGRSIENAGQSDRKVYQILALAKDGTSQTEYERLERQAAKVLSLGNSLKGLRAEVQKLYRPIPKPRAETSLEVVPASGPVALGDTLDPLSFPHHRVTNDGVKILDHQENIRHLLASYGLSMRYNEISKQIEWHHPDILQQGDNAENALFSQVISLCSLNKVPKGSLDTHLTALANSNPHNPVVEHLASLKWDGLARFDALAEAMQPSQLDVTRIAIRLFLIQACAAADHAERAAQLNPFYDRHFETVVVFVGDQGLGKTKGIRSLLPAGLRSFYKEGVALDLRNKDSVKAAVSSWIVELGELDATFRKSDIVQLKAFLSLSHDEIRMPYARKASIFHRRTAFVGTVNESEFLADQTGNRRYVPLQVTRVKVDWTDNELDQLWAEAWQRYCSGEKWWADTHEEKLLAENAESYRVKSEIEEAVEGRFAWGEPPDFNAGRMTATALLRELFPGRYFEQEVRNAKNVASALDRLWKSTGVTTFVNGQWRVKNPSGQWIAVNALGGKNAGWLLPPRRSVRSQTESPAVASLKRRAAATSSASKTDLG